MNVAYVGKFSLNYSLSNLEKGVGGVNKERIVELCSGISIIICKSIHV